MKDFWKKFTEWFFMMWRPLLIFLGVSLVVGFTLGFHLGSLTRLASQPEQRYIASVSSGKELAKHPVYIVHKLPVYVLFKLHVRSIAAYRAISAIFASLAVVSCFFVIREWYTNRVAILTTWLFLSSAWVLHVGRLATPEASFLLLMPLLWAAVWLYNTTLRKSALLLLSFLCAASFYIPGFGWLLLMTALWKRDRIWDELKVVPWWFQAICGLVIVVGLVPLAWASVGSPRELLLAAGLPNHVPHIRALAENLLGIPEQFFLRGPNDAVRWLGRLPLLDIFSSAMLLLGLYSMRYHLKVTRIQLLVGSSLLLALLITLGGPVTLTVLTPAVYISIAGGVAFMLQQWFTVFPRNPIARTIATTIISTSILLVSYYHISHYFIAWPQTPATKQAFGLQITNPQAPITK